MSAGATVELVGWLATALFSVSYFLRRPVHLRRVQSLAAVVWIVYGVLISSRPVVVANVIVATLALWSSLRRPDPAGIDSRS